MGWVWGASRIVKHDTGEILSENCFYENGRPREFLKLPTDLRGALRVITSADLLRDVLADGGLYAGLQNSVIRKRFFDDYRFDVSFYNEAEDQLAVLRAIAKGVKFGYLNSVHVMYHVHGENSSGAASGMARDKRLRLIRGLIKGYEGLPNSIALSKSQADALSRRLANLHFWTLGYGFYWQHADYRSAFQSYLRAIRVKPTYMALWKSFMKAFVVFILLKCKAYLFPARPRASSP